MQNIDNNSYLISEGVKQLGYSVAPEAISQLLSYLEALKQWNARINLTAIRTDRGIIIRHFLDSLAGLEALPAENSPEAPWRMMDVGTGAGFPGLPIKILRPKIQLTLLEPRKKKAAFLHSVCGQLGLQGVSILAERLEMLAKQPQHQGRYDILMSRALKASEFLGPASSLLHGGGRIVLWAAAQAGEDLLQKNKGFSGWDRSRVVSYRLPFEGVERSLVMLQKI